MQGEVLLLKNWLALDCEVRLPDLLLPRPPGGQPVTQIPPFLRVFLLVGRLTVGPLGQYFEKLWATHSVLHLLAPHYMLSTMFALY